MKVLVLAFACGVFNYFMGLTTEFIDNLTGMRRKPRASFHVQIVDERWECPRCNHDNGDWTSICGFCGRSRPRG